MSPPQLKLLEKAQIEEIKLSELIEALPRGSVDEPITYVVLTCRSVISDEMREYVAGRRLSLEETPHIKPTAVDMEYYQTCMAESCSDIDFYISLQGLSQEKLKELASNAGMSEGDIEALQGQEDTDNLLKMFLVKNRGDDRI